MPSLIDLFSGAGGFSRGFYERGYNILFAIEKDLDAAIAYKSNFPMAKVWVRDIRRVHSKEIKDTIGDVDIIIASPPCEAFTTISMNIMKDPLDRLYTDPRGRLTLEAIRIIGDLKPLIFVIENVPGILINPIPNLLRKEFRRIGYSKIFLIF